MKGDNMPIDSVNRTIPMSGKRFITPQMQNNVQDLLTRMNSETKENSNAYRTCAAFVKSIKYKDEAEFTDGRMIFKKVSPEEQMVKESFLQINKTSLVIDNKTGEIIEHRKPFFSRWSKIMKKAEKYLNLLKNNYDNPELVKKEWLQHKELTPEGKKASKLLDFSI